MNEAEAIAKLRELIAAEKNDQLMQMHVRKLCVHAPSAFMRIVMAVEGPASPSNFSDWKEVVVDTDTLDQPVTLSEIEAWLARDETSDALVSWLTTVMPRETAATPFAFEDYLELVRRKRFSSLPRVLFHEVSYGSSRYRRIAEAEGDALADALIASDPMNLPHWLGDALPAPALGRVLEERARRKHRVSFSDLRMYRRAYEHAPAAYTQLLCEAARAVKANDVHLIAMPSELPSEALEAVLEVLKGKEKLFGRAAAQAMAYSPRGAPTALAAFLGHAKRGKLAARLLAVSGEAGRRAAIDARDAQGKKKSKTAERVRELVAQLEKLPEGRAWLVAIANQPSGWSLDPSRWTIAEPPTGGEKPTHAPTSAEVLRRALEDDVHDAEDLEPPQWADLLQVVTIHGWKQDLEWAVDAAKSLGRLGWGNDPASVWRAIERYDTNQYVSIRHSSGDKAMGLFHLLIGAEAPLELLLHAFARSAEGQGNLTLGQSQRNFTNALRNWDVDERVELELIAQHLDMVRYHKISPAEIDRYPTLEEAADLGSSWSSAEPRLDFRFRTRVKGATKVAVRVREGIELGVDLETYRWWQKGLDGADGGQTSLLGEVDSVVLDVESVGSKMRFTVNGTAVASGPQGHLYTGLPAKGGPIVVETDGTIESVRVTDMLPQGEANDMAALLVFEDETAVRDLQDTAKTPAAHALAVETLLGENEAVVKASREALSALGDAAEPYLEALGMEASTDDAPTGFEVRSFDACVDAFAASNPKKKLKVIDDPQFGFAKAAAFGNPREPEWSSGVSEDTLYLWEGGEDHLANAADLLNSSIPAVKVWNKKGDGHWAGETGTYLIASASFWPDEYDDYGEYSEVIVAAWKVKEGVAVAAWKDDPKVLAEIMGVPWPSKRSWQSLGEVWIGE